MKLVGEQILKPRKLLAKKVPSTYNRKVSDGGNGDLLKSLIILEELFPLFGEGEAETLPD